MKDWKIKQLLTHKTHVHEDLQENHPTVIYRREEMYGIDFQAEVINYFLREGDGYLYYPQKSYSVGLIYAKLLQRYFKEDFYVALDDPDLLLSDPHFVRYRDDKRTYDQLIFTMSHLNLWDFENNPISQVQASVSYFKKEFLVV